MVGYSTNVALADGGTFTAPVNGIAEISATSGTVTLQMYIKDAYSNCPTTIANGNFLALGAIQQGTTIKITGGTANLHFWK